jgi:hypothetical protein
MQKKIIFLLHIFFSELARRHIIFSLSSVVDPDPHQTERGDPDPHQTDKLDPDMESQNV